MGYILSAHEKAEWLALLDDCGYATQIRDDAFSWAIGTRVIFTPSWVDYVVVYHDGSFHATPGYNQLPRVLGTGASTFRLNDLHTQSINMRKREGAKRRAERQANSMLKHRGLRGRLP